MIVHGEASHRLSERTLKCDDAKMKWCMCAVITLEEGTQWDVRFRRKIVRTEPRNA